MPYYVLHGKAVAGPYRTRKEANSMRDLSLRIDGINANNKVIHIK